MEDQKECLICSKDLQENGKYFALEKKTTETFLLQNVLEISQSTCSEIESKRQKDSASLFSFCKKCYSTVLETERVFKEFMNLKAKWETLQVELRIKITKSSEKQPRKSGPKSKIRDKNIIQIIRNESAAKKWEWDLLNGEVPRFNRTKNRQEDNDQEEYPDIRDIKVEQDAEDYINENCEAEMVDEIFPDKRELVHCKSEFEMNPEEDNDKVNLNHPGPDENETSTKPHRLKRRKKYTNSEIEFDNENLSSNGEFNPEDTLSDTNSNISISKAESVVTTRKKGKFPCDFCTTVSSTPIQLKDHQRRSHGVKHKFQCKSCKRCLSNGYTLLRHIYSVHKQHSLKSKSVKLEKSKNVEMKNVARIKECNEKLEAAVEDNKFESAYLSSLNEDPSQQKIEFGEYPCDFCPKISNTLATKKQHERYAHNIKHEFKCDKCQKCLSNGYTLLRHIQSVHNETKKRGRKNSVKKESASSTSVANSNSEVTSCTDIPISDVTVPNTNENDAVSENGVIVEDSELGEFVCEFCPNISKTLLKKKVHEWRAHNVKHTFQCSKCRKCLANGYTLLRHIRSVHSIKKRMRRRFNITKPPAVKKTVSNSCGVASSNDNANVPADLNETDSADLRENEYISEETELGDFVCEFCPNVSKTLLKKKIHESYTHGVKHTFQCQKCNKCLANGYTLMRHIQSVHIQKKTRAKKYKKRDYRDCGEETARSESSPSVCTEQLAQCQSGTEFEENFSSLAAISGHFDLSSIQDCELGIFTCDHCPILSSTRLKKMEHERRAHGIKHKFQCPSCNRCLANGYTLLRHFISVHIKKKARKKKYSKKDDAMSVNAQAARKVRLKYDSIRNISGALKCQHCGKLCATPEKKNDHENRAHGESHKFICEHCSKYFLTYYSFERHVFDMHPTTVGNQNNGSTSNPDAKYSHVLIFKCQTCGQICKSAAKLEQHIRKVHETKGSGKTFLCQQCGKNFPSPWDLRNHEFRVHDIEVPFACKLCKRSYTTEAKLQGHVVLLHTLNQEPVDCLECAKKFGNKTSLHRHVSRVHRKERN